MSYVFNIAYFAALALLSPWLLYKSLTTEKYRRGLAAKLLGKTPLRDGRAPCAWFHGVSVGEIHLLRQLVGRFRRRHPDWHCVVSTTTDTGFEEACKRFPDLTVFHWPFDFSWSVRRALRQVNPSLIILAESELWPNFLAAARARGVPIAVVNGRMSPRSLARWQAIFRPPTAGWKSIVSRPVAALVRAVLAPVLDGVSLWAVQTEEYALSFAMLDVRPEKIYVTGSIKYDGVNGDRDNPKTEALRRLFAIAPGDLVWIAGSTQEPEEKIALEAYHRLNALHPALRLFLVPRQKDRFDDVARLLQRSQLPFLRRSTVQTPVTDRSAVVLVDSIGELSALWGLADVAFVGGSLDGKRGGQNMIEPAAFGAAVLFGPHVWNFRDTAERLLTAGGALAIADATELEATVGQLLADPGRREQLGTAARTFVASQSGATDRTIALFDRLIRSETRESQAA